MQVLKMIGIVTFFFVSAFGLFWLHGESKKASQAAYDRHMEKGKQHMVYFQQAGGVANYNYEEALQHAEQAIVHLEAASDLGDPGPILLDAIATYEGLHKAILEKGAHQLETKIVKPYDRAANKLSSLVDERNKSK